MSQNFILSAKCLKCVWPCGTLCINDLTFSFLKLRFDQIQRYLQLFLFLLLQFLDFVFEFLNASINFLNLVLVVTWSLILKLMDQLNFIYWTMQYYRAIKYRRNQNFDHDFSFEKKKLKEYLRPRQTFYAHLITKTCRNPK